MKNIAFSATALMLLFLCAGVALPANPLFKPPATQFSQQSNSGTPQQLGPWAQTTPGVSMRVAFVDLAVTEISVQELGQGALIRVTVKNLGTAAADANLYRLRVLQDGTPLPGGVNHSSMRAARLSPTILG